MRGLGGAAAVVAVASVLGMIWMTVARAGIESMASFAPRSDVPLGPSGCDPIETCSAAPFAIAAEDLDGDGDVDLATANNASADVSILLGDGEGGFAFGAAIPVGDQPTAIAVGALDADPRLDLVVANEASSTLSVVRGGDGGFEPATTVDIASGPDAFDNPPSDVVLAHVDDDAFLDAVAVSLDADKLTVLLGNGDGSFGEPMVSALAGGPVLLAAGDLDGDRDVDLAVSLDARAAVAILLGDGDGSFEAAGELEVGEAPTGVVIADFDGDENADVAVASERADGVWVLLGTGGGSFAAAEDYDVGAAPASLAAGDFDGDGFIDLVSADNLGTLELDGSISVLSGRGDGSFAPARFFETDPGGFDVVAIDVNRDRKPDVLTANMESDDVSVLLNTAIGPFFGCAGDCDLDGAVSIDELVRGVSLSIDPAELDSCRALDRDGDRRVGIDELLRAVRDALSNCEIDGSIGKS